MFKLLLLKSGRTISIFLVNILRFLKINRQNFASSDDRDKLLLLCQMIEVQHIYGWQVYQCIYTRTVLITYESFFVIQLNKKNIA